MINKKTIEDMWGISRVEQKRSEKSRTKILLDMIHCRKAYGTTARGYLSFGFSMLEEQYRKDYLSAHILIKLVNQINRRELDSKWTAYKNLGQFYKRDCVHLIESSPEEIAAFLEKHQTFFAKQVDSTCGQGVRFVEQNGDKKTLENELREGEYLMLEEPIVQHEAFNEINESSINTLRFVTVRNDQGEVIFLPTVMRVSSDDSKVDNIGHGGLYTMFDENGVIQLDGFFQENVHKLSGDSLIVPKHPKTGYSPKGKTLPYYHESKQLVEEMAKASPELRLVGWDIAVGVDGPDLVELNAYPDVHFNQNYYFTEILNQPSVGAKKIVEEHLGIKIKDDYTIEQVR